MVAARVYAADASGGGEVSDEVLQYVTQVQSKLPGDEQATLFTEFTRLVRHSQTEGHGLGLSIVRRIAMRLGGEVGVESAAGQGSTFYFILPASPVSAQPADLPAAAVAPASVVSKP